MNSTTEVIDPPQPLSNSPEYNDKAVKQRLKYAHHTLNNSERKLSPLGMHALRLYKEACANFLSLQESEIFNSAEEFEEAKNKWISTLRTYEQALQYQTFLKTTNSEDAQNMQERLLSLQRAAFYARYGDYLVEVCTKLKREAEVHKVKEWRALQGLCWTQIYKNIEAEKMDYKLAKKDPTKIPVCPTHLAISEACCRVGFSMHDILSAIQHYALRNELRNANILIIVKDGDYHTLAKTLHDDYCDLPRLAPPDKGLPSELMLTTIQSMIDLWFRHDVDDFENYRSWVPTEALTSLRTKIKSEGETTVKKELDHEITKTIQKNLRETEKEEKLVKAARDFFLVSNKSTKRVASSQLEEEKKRAKMMKIAWDKIEGISCGLRKMTDSYRTEYGELAPLELIPGPSLDHDHDDDD